MILEYASVCACDACGREVHTTGSLPDDWFQAPPIQIDRPDGMGYYIPTAIHLCPDCKNLSLSEVVQSVQAQFVKRQLL